MHDEIMLNFIVFGKVREDYVGFSNFMKLWQGRILVLDTSSGVFKVLLKSSCRDYRQEDFFKEVLNYVDTCYLEVYFVIVLSRGTLSEFKKFLGECSSVGRELRCVRRIGRGLAVFTQVRRTRDGKLTLKSTLLRSENVFSNTSLTEISSLRVHLCDANVKEYALVMCSVAKEILNKVKELM